MKRMTFAVLSLGLCALPLWVAAQSSTSKAGKPAIEITKVPPSDPGGPDKMATISGTVSNPCENCRVVLYTHGDLWYVQPYSASPFTAVRANGTWSNQTHLGTEYAALLVMPGYKPLATSPDLPEVSGSVVALTVVQGRR